MDEDYRDFFLKAKAKSVRPMKMTDTWRFEAMEAVIEAARLYIAMRKATVETEADSGLLPQSLYDLEASQLATLDKAIAILDGTNLKAG